jgi:hypothetical protein
VWDFPDPATVPANVRVTPYLRPLEGAVSDWFSLDNLADPSQISNIRLRETVKAFGLHTLAKRVKKNDLTKVRQYEQLRTTLLLRFVAEGTVETAEVIAPGKFGRCIICRGA